MCNAPGIQQGKQPGDRVVERIVGHQGSVELQRVDRAVGDEDLAVAVGQNAAGGLHRLHACIGADGLVQVIVPVEDLRVKHRGDEPEQKQHKKSAERSQAVTELLGLHGGLLS